MDQTARIRHHFRRRQDAAHAGLHLPTEEELLKGMSFFRSSLEHDIREYGDRLSRSLSRRKATQAHMIVPLLEELTVDQSKEAVARVANGFERAVMDDDEVWIDAGSLRCTIYLAHFGDLGAVGEVAVRAASLAHQDLQSELAIDLLRRSLAWTMTKWQIQNIDVPPDSRRSMVRKCVPRFDAALQKRFQKLAAPIVKDTDPVGGSPLDLPFWEPAGEDDTKSVARDRRSAILFSRIGNTETSEGKNVARSYGQFLDEPLRLSEVPDLRPVRKNLLEEFPHARDVIDTILNGIAGKEIVLIKPTVLLGEPGSGKTRFARRVLEELGVPHELISCGGMSDSSIGGTARRWSSGEPSIAVRVACRFHHAGPGIILDEIEKVSTGGKNGSVHDVLIGLFEPESSSRWSDPYIEADCDLSHVSWLMTANEVASVPAALKDRCRIIAFPSPSAGQVQILARRILEDVYAARGQDRRWALPFDGVEYEALTASWQGGSLRALRKFIEKIVDVREQGQSTN